MSEASPDDRMKVFISSSLRDLREYRKAVINQLGQYLGLEVQKNDMMDASQNQPLDEMFRLIEESDIFVGIYAHRYGHIPEGQQSSYIELEYDYARSLGKPTFCYILDRNQQWPSNMFDDDTYLTERLDQFKEKILKELVVAFFTTPDDLAIKVRISIEKYLAEKDEEPQTEEEISPSLPGQPTSPSQEVPGQDNVLPPEGKTDGAEKTTGSADESKTQSGGSTLS